MANLKDMAESRTALMHFDPRMLKVKPGLNARDMKSPEVVAHIAWLAASIAEDGVKVPLEIFSEGDDIFVASGHCRLAATMLAIGNGAEIKTVPCTPERRGSNEVDRFLNQILDNSGLRLTPLEEGANIRRAHNLGWSVEQIARKLGKSVSHVRGAIDFQAAPAEVHNAVRNGEMSATLASQIVKAAPTPEKAVETVRESVRAAKDAGKTKATARFVKPSGKSKASAPEETFDAGAVKIDAKGPSLVGVKITGTEIVRDRQFWDKLANRILDFLETP